MACSPSSMSTHCVHSRHVPAQPPWCSPGRCRSGCPPSKPVLLPAEPGGMAVKTRGAVPLPSTEPLRAQTPPPSPQVLWARPVLPTSQLQPRWLLTACLFLPQGLCTSRSLCLDPSSLPAFILTRVTTSEGPHWPPELTQSPLIPCYPGKHWPGRLAVTSGRFRCCRASLVVSPPGWAASQSPTRAGMWAVC